MTLPPPSIPLSLFLRTSDQSIPGWPPSWASSSKNRSSVVRRPSEREGSGAYNIVFALQMKTGLFWGLVTSSVILVGRF